ncbi:MAG: NEW3 domain-containing protein [Anaerolineae bacterium]
MQRLKMFALFTTLVLVAAAIGGPPALAQGGGQQTISPQLTLFTRYPAQEAAIGESVTFKLTLRAADTPQTAHFELRDLPEDWTASFRGGGRVVEAAFVDPEDEATVDLRLEPPADVAAGTYRFSVVALGDNGQAELPIELIVKEKLPPSLEFNVDLPTLRGSPTTTFRYNATLKNEGDQDLAVNLVAEAPLGFNVKFKLSGQDVVDIPLEANASKRLTIEAKAFTQVPAGTYPINILAQSDEAQAQINLTAEVTGQPDLTVTAPDGRLSGQAYVGDITPLKIVVQNNGSAPARGIKMSASQPSGWSVEFEPKEIAQIAPGKQVEVTANIQPADKAVAGDYMITVRARPEDGSSESAEFRITVRTSTLWGVAGVALIAVAVAVVGLAVIRFGRR